MNSDNSNDSLVGGNHDNGNNDCNEDDDGDDDDDDDDDDGGDADYDVDEDGDGGSVGRGDGGEKRKGVTASHSSHICNFPSSFRKDFQPCLNIQTGNSCCWFYTLV